jgi:hypothetical protein
MPSVGFEPTISAIKRQQTYGYIGVRTDTTQHSEQTPDKEGEINHFIAYGSCYTKTDTTGCCLPTTPKSLTQ